MGASDLTTEAPEAGNGEVVDGDRSASVSGHAAKKRKRQKALAVVAANGHVSKLTPRKPLVSNGAIVERDAPAVDEPEPRDDADPAVVTPEVPAVEDYDDAELPRAFEDYDDTELLDKPGYSDEPVARKRAPDAIPADRGRRARKRAAKRAQARPHRRAARRAKAAYDATPAGRRAALVATAAGLAAAAAAVEGKPASIGRKRAAKYARRLAAVIALAMIPAAIYVLVATDSLAPPLSRADARFLSAELMTADQRVRRQLVRLRPGQTRAAIFRTRDATLSARSLSIELANASGKDADLVRRALTLESAWLDAVGSVLSNPRSPLREELVARDAALRPALDALPVPEGRRKGGAAHLVRYASSRIAAKR